MCPTPTDPSPTDPSPTDPSPTGPAPEGHATGRTLLLASTSSYRQHLLGRLGLGFVVAAPDYDERRAEQRLLAEGATPREVAAELALGKAQAVAERYPDKVILAADQLAALDRVILGKPLDRSRALAQLETLSGVAHELVTAVAILTPNSTPQRHLDVTRMTMRKLSRDDRERYVDLDQPFDCAGSYRIEDHGISLFECIESQDASAIEGLPLLAVSKMLRKLGFSFPA